MTTLRIRLLVAFLCVALLPVILIAVRDYRAMQAALTQAAYQSLFAAASQTTVRLDAFIRSNSNVIGTEALVPALSEYLSRPADARDEGGRKAQVLDILRVFTQKDTVFIASYALLDLDGHNILDTQAANIGLNESRMDYFREAIDTGLPSAARIQFAPQDNTAYLNFSSLVSTPAGKPVGVLRARYSATVLQYMMAENTGMVAPQSFAMLLDENGLLLANGLLPPGSVTEQLYRLVQPLAPASVSELQADQRLPSLPSAEIFLNWPDLAAGLVKVDEPQPYFTVQLRDGNGAIQAAAATRMSSRPWVVVFLQPQEVFLAPMRAQTHNVVLLGLVVVALVSIAAIGTAQRLTRPIVRLTAVARRVAEGDLNARADITSHDETGMLGKTFNTMAERLAQTLEGLRKSEIKLTRHRDHLDDLVRERTAELVVAKERAEVANRSKSTFLASMSHELRTPLNAVLGYAQVLKQDSSISEHGRAGLNTIQSSGEHLLTLINDILDLSKIEAGKLELLPDALDLRPFLQALTEAIRVKAEAKGLAFSLELAASLPPGVKADEVRLRQVLFNLLTNAVKFSDHGTITLRVLKLGGDNASVQLHFEVQDSGIGIAADDLQSIFEPFEQVGELHRRLGGTGLGLAISRQLVERMGGELMVSSVPDHGSRFWFDLNLPTTDLPAQAPPAPRRIGYRGARRSVLVCDDVAGNRDMLRYMLVGLGFEVIEACDGQEAITQAQLRRFDLVLMDLLMPVMDGVEAICRLRADARFAATPIIALSAGALEGEGDKSLAAGANAFLTKPVVIDILQQHIGTLLQLSWIEEKEESPPDAVSSDTLVAPPGQELDVLWRLAKVGNMSSIGDYADQLAALDTRYSPFAAQLRHLADKFQSRAILDLVGRYRNAGASKPDTVREM